jgi:UDP-glucose 4-epimerase
LKAAVTGGAGFIGHHLVRGLLERGHEVSVIDDLSTGTRARLESLQGDVQQVEGSILDPGALDAVLSGCELVFHEAALASVPRSIEEPQRCNAVNVTGTIEVMLAAARSGVRRIVLASSSAVYGVPAALPCTERDVPAPVSPYGASKLAGEHFARTLGEALGVETVSLRYFNVFGPGQDPGSTYAAVIPRFIDDVLHGRRPTINGSEAITRDFIYIDDVVEANVRAADADVASGLVCNVASGLPTSLVDLLGAIGAATGVSPDPLIGPARAGDIPASVGDPSLARAAIGFQPAVSLEEGIARTVEWFAIDGRRSLTPATPT